MRGNNVMKGYFADDDGDGRGVPRRLVPLRRSRRHASGRLYRGAGPRQGHHHLGRRKHLDDRGRARAVRASRTVLEAAVVAIPDERWGERPKAFVTLSAGAEADRRELIAFCARDAARLQGAERRSNSASCRRRPPAKYRSTSLRARVRERRAGCASCALPTHTAPTRHPAARRDDRREPPRDRRALRRPRGARRPPPGLPRDLSRAVGGRSGRAARGLLARGVEKGDRVGIWAPNRFEWVVTPVRDRAHRRDPRQRQPGVQAVRARVRAERSPASACSARARLPADRTTSRCSTTVRGRCPALREALVLEDDWDALLAVGATVRERDARRERGGAPVRRPDQHPVHLRAPPGFPKGATLSHHNILNNALLHRRGARATPSRTACASRCRSTTASAW